MDFRSKLFSLSVCCISLSMLPQAHSEEPPTSTHEALLLKRIVEYWKDEDYALAKKQILDFLKNYTSSPFTDHLLTMLGDLYFEEDNFKEAAITYSRIGADAFKEKCFLKHAKALFELKDFAQVTTLTQPHLQHGVKTDSEQNLQLAYLHANALLAQGQLLEAHPIFEELSKTVYRPFCLLPLAESHVQKQEFPKAVALYTESLESHPSQQEELLMRIAALQAHYDKPTAAKTFLKAAELRQKSASIAAFNHLTLLFELGESAQVVQAANQWMDLIPESERPIANYYLGSSHFRLKDYAASIAPLEAFVRTQTEATPFLRAALGNLMLAARQTEDAPLSERVIALLKRQFSQDPAYLQSLLVHAELTKESSGLLLNDDELKKLLEISQDFEGRDKLFYDLALLLIEEQRLGAARSVLELFLSKYPKSAHCPLAYRHLLNTSIEALKNNEETLELKEGFANDLTRILSQEGVLSEQEAKELHLTLVKTLFELKKLPLALEQTEAFLERYPSDELAADAHLLAALCIQEATGDFVKRALHLERALFLDPRQEETHLLHLQLFNTYLTLSSQDLKQHELYLDKAADHLYLAFMQERMAVSFDNQVWLANHYLAKVREHKATHPTKISEQFLPLQRSIATYERLLGFEENFSSLPQDKDIVLLEGEALKYAELLSLTQQHPKKLTLLQMLSSLYIENPSVQWKSQKALYFELAKAYEEQNDLKRALEMYDKLLNTTSLSFLSEAAQLQKARLQFTLLPAEERLETSPQVIDILNELKDLQIKKQLQNEPVHIEAALEYVHLRVLLAQEETKLDKHLFYLKRVKEDFLSEDDAIGKEYVQALKELPEKKRVLDQYMVYIDAEMLRLTAEKESLSGQKEKALALFKQADAKLDKLSQGERELTPFLQARIKESKEDLSHSHS